LASFDPKLTTASTVEPDLLAMPAAQVPDFAPLNLGYGPLDTNLL